MAHPLDHLQGARLGCLAPQQAGLARRDQSVLRPVHERHGDRAVGHQGQWRRGERPSPVHPDPDGAGREPPAEPGPGQGRQHQGAGTEEPAPPGRRADQDQPRHWQGPSPVTPPDQVTKGGHRAHRVAEQDDRPAGHRRSSGRHVEALPVAHRAGPLRATMAPGVVGQHVEAGPLQVRRQGPHVGVIRGGGEPVGHDRGRPGRPAATPPPAPQPHPVRRLQDDLIVGHGPTARGPRRTGDGTHPLGAHCGPPSHGRSLLPAMAGIAIQGLNPWEIPPTRVPERYRQEPGTGGPPREVTCEIPGHR